MLTLLLAAVLQTQTTPQQWYGPETVSFNVAFAGNPYDPEKSDVRVRFIDGKGNQTERLAYYDDEAAAWKAVLVADHPGMYRPIMFRNGKQLETLPEPELVDIGTKPILPGFVRRDPVDKIHFHFDDGTPYIPLGFNLAWQNPGRPTIEEGLRTMGRNGINWSRIWATKWDGKNPWWTNAAPENSDFMDGDAFRKWDAIVSAAEDAGVAFQFVLFNLGAFSTKVDANFAEHPWNKAKGGFLERASDFFTNPEAKRRTKMWLRYAVARWGHSNSILAWELFNEVENTDARFDDRWKDVVAWHQEMADYLRSVDPYHHLVTSSSATEVPGLYDALDFYQPHGYLPDTRAQLSDWKQPGDKPAFFGEVGPPKAGNTDSKTVIRDAIWSGLLSSHAGGGSFWDWDEVDRANLYGEWKLANRILDESGYRAKLNARPIPVRVVTPESANLVFSPGLEWGKSTASSFNLEYGKRPVGLAGLSSFLQGTAHPELGSGPLKFTFRAMKPGKFVLSLGQVSKAGASVHLTLDGKPASSADFAAEKEDRRAMPSQLAVDYAAGSHEITVANTGTDWATMNSFTFGGMDFEASAQGIGTVDWLMVRVRANSGADPKTATLSSFGLGQGTYNMTIFDLETGKSSQRQITISGITHQEKLDLPGHDCIIVFRTP